MISGTALASTWNEELAEKVGDTLGMEARGRGKTLFWRRESTFTGLHYADAILNT